MKPWPVFVLLAMPLRLDAQEAAPAAPAALSLPPAGSRVRLETRTVVGRRVIGSLTTMNQGFVSLALDPARSPGSEISVPWSGIHDISLSGGEDTRRGIATGALVGLGASIIVYPALTQTVEAGESRLGPVLLSFGLLPVAGAVIGSFNGPERWMPLRWRPTTDTVMPEGERTRLRLAPETQVRVLVASRWIRARVLDTTDDSLVVRRASRREAYDWESVMLLNRRTRRSRIRGAALGFTMAGAATLASLASKPAGSPRRAHTIPLTLIAGAAVGALIGTAGWTGVPVPVR